MLHIYVYTYAHVIKFKRSILSYLVIFGYFEIKFNCWPLTAIFCLGLSPEEFLKTVKCIVIYEAVKAKCFAVTRTYSLWGNQWSTSVCSTLPVLMVLSLINTWNLTSPLVWGSVCFAAFLSSTSNIWSDLLQMELVTLSCLVLDLL